MLFDELLMNVGLSVGFEQIFRALKTAELGQGPESGEGPFNVPVHGGDGA